MNRQQLVELIKAKKSFLCVGLDTQLDKIPESVRLADDPVYEFNKQIVDATIDVATAYKPNTAFYEALGADGWRSLEKTIDYINRKYPNQAFTIADAKRGDIGNTCDQYARAFFERMDFDAITLNPYMGADSITPFLKYKDKWAVVLSLTSNPSSLDFQHLQPQLPTLLEKLGMKTCYWKKLYEIVVEKSFEWGNEQNIMFVAGATQAEMIAGIREIAPQHFLLVPGVGAQGGSLQEVCKYGMNKDCGLLINASRSIIYAGNADDFALKAREEACKMQKEMELLLKF